MRGVAVVQGAVDRLDAARGAGSASTGSERSVRERRRRPRLTGRLSALALCAGLVTTACGQEQEELAEPYGAPSQETAAPPEPPPAAPVDTSSCPATHPLPLQWVPENDQERAALEGLVGCADTAQASIWLDNSSDAVWVVERPAGLSWTGAPDVPLDVALFRSAAATDGRLPVEPGITATIAAAPAELRLVLSEDASASWATVQWFEAAADDKAEDGFAKAMAAGRASRATFVECARAGWDAGELIESAPLAEGSDKVQVLSDALGLTAQGSSCGAAVALATEQARAQAPGADAVVVTEEDLLRVARSPASTQLDDASKALGLASDFASGLRVLLRG